MHYGMTEVRCPQCYSGSVPLHAHHDRHVTSFSAQRFVQVHQARVAHGVERALRHAKRYHVSDSPLTAISWWRLMLDEAQNVGDGFSQAHLSPGCSWDVTATPACGQLSVPGA